jgi:hypothetical protein
LVTVVHAPVPEEHAVQSPLQVALEQQYPLLHAPLVQAAFEEHDVPAGTCDTHAPDELQ